jgi:hypothetical protein
MSTDTSKTSPDAQRDALKESEKKSNEQQPRSYDERNEKDKVVRIDPTETDTDKAIRGIDPKQ